MRNLARFLFLFGAGLALLLLLDWEQEDDLLGDGRRMSRTAQTAGEVTSRSGAVETGDRGDFDGRVILDGELDYTRYGAPNGGNTRPAVYRVHAVDVDHLDSDAYRLHELEARIYDEASGGVRLLVQARGGTALISDGRGTGGGYSVGEGGRVTLETARARWMGDVLSPTILTADHMRGSPGGGEWVATGHVQLEAPDLTATGIGLHLSPEEGRAVFVENGRLTVEEAGVARAVLDSAGPLTLARTSGPGTGAAPVPGTFRVDGSGGCRLLLADGADLEADAVHLEGRSPTGTGQSEDGTPAEDEAGPVARGLGLTAARALGTVRLRRGPDLFTGDEAAISLGAGGKPRTAELTALAGSKVTGRIPLGGPLATGAGGAAGAEEAARTLNLEGAGPLTVQFAADRDPSTQGQAENTPAGFRLRGPARLVLAGSNPEADEAGGALEAAGLVEGRREKDGSLFLVTTGMTHLKGTAAEGRPYTLDASDGLEAHGAGEAFRLQRAGGITLRLLGEDPLMARADELRDFDSVAGTFTVSGDVELTAIGWTVTAQRVVRAGPKDLVLTGSPDPDGEPAHYVNRAPQVGSQTSLLEVRGRSIEMRGDEAHARGDVSARLWVPATRGYVMISGGADGRFTVRADGSGFLESDGEPVVASGTMGIGGTAWEVTGERIAFSPERFEVIGADLTWGVEPASAAPDRERGAGALGEGGPLRARARRLWASETHLVLYGEAQMSGTLEDGRPWDLSAGRLRFLPHDPELVNAPPIPFEPRLRRLEANGGFALCLGTGPGDGPGAGLSMAGTALDLTGESLRADGAPLLVDGEGMALETTHIDVDFGSWLPTSASGTLRGGLGTDAAWSLAYESLAPAGASADGTEGEDVLALREPLHRSPQRTLRGSWLLLWLDGPAWRARGRAFLGLGEAPREATAAEEGQARPPFLGVVDLPAEPGLIQSVYAEGDIEILEGPVRRARADRLHLDLREGGGWLDGADLILDVDVRGEPERLRTRARRMIHAADGSLHADNATITSCNQDEPHYVVETGDLTIFPVAAGRTGSGGAAGWEIAARDNVLRLPLGPPLPLPPLVYATDEEGNPIIENIILSNSARFGTALGATFNREVGGLGRGIATMLGAPKDDLDGHWRYRASWLGKRGILLGAGLRLRAPGTFEFALDADGVDDGRQDLGLVRVESAGRAGFRGWTRGRGRWTLGESSWVDLVFSSQTDAGVQAEFFEREYLEFEERESYLHGRWSDGNLFGSARARIAADHWRSDVEELPATGLSAARTPVLAWGDAQLLWSADMDAGLFRRRQGDPRYELLFDDGPLVVEGDPHVGRLDHVQRLEMPLHLGFAGLKATPRLEGRLTAWDRGLDESAAPRRLTSIGGIDLATTFTRRFASGAVHQVSPRLGLAHTFSWNRSGGTPVPMDSMEDDPRGTALEFGLVTRLFRPGSEQRLDVDLRGAFGEETPGEVRRWLPLSALAEWRGEVFGTPVGLVHDGIYDGEEGLTEYSRTEFGLGLANGLGLEVGYRSARESGGARFYEAATAAARYRATPIWELEFRETFSLQDELALHEKLTLRRLGHDFLFEIGIGNRRGEGGGTLSFTIEPLLGWRRRSLGLLDRWRLGSW